MRISPTKPHIFKPILPGFKNGLKIPTYFSKYILGTAKGYPDEALLKKKGNEWRVNVINGHFVGDGWRRFAEENNLETGDFVVLEHHGNLVFDATIFDGITQCKKEHRTDGERRPSKKSRFEASISKAVEDEIPSDDGEEEKEPDYSSIDRPHFIARINQSNTGRCFLYVPRAFARSNGLMGRKGEIIVKDEQERSWYFDLSTSADGDIHIRRGSTMAEFFAANGFKKDDSFKFEVVVAGDREEVPVVRILFDQSNDCPYYVYASTIKPYSLGRNQCLIIPMKFARTNGLREKHRMILENKRGRTWEVNLNIWQYRLGICGGWKKFVDENGIKEGDAYKFEVVENGPVPVVRFIVTDG